MAHRLGSVLSQSFGEAESCEASSIVKADHLLFDAGRAARACRSSRPPVTTAPPSRPVTTPASSSRPASRPRTRWSPASARPASPPPSRPAPTSRRPRGTTCTGRAAAVTASCTSARRSRTASSTPAGRGVPDISYSGDVNNGLLIAWSEGDPANTGDIFMFGGTSAGSPQWAAIAALADQANHRRLGSAQRQPVRDRAQLAVPLRVPRHHHRQQLRLADRHQRQPGDHRRLPGHQGLGRGDRPRHARRRPPAQVPALGAGRAGRDADGRKSAPG